MRISGILKANYEFLYKKLELLKDKLLCSNFHKISLIGQPRVIPKITPKLSPKDHQIDHLKKKPQKFPKYLSVKQT